jgi:hypothetical protein
MTENLIEEHRDALETVANADLPASWIAKELLSSVEGHQSYESEESNVTPHTEPTEPVSISR